MKNFLNKKIGNITVGNLLTALLIFTVAAVATFYLIKK